MLDSNYNIDSILVARNFMSINSLIERVYLKIHRDAIVVAYQDAKLKNIAIKHNASIGKEYNIRIKKIRSMLKSSRIKKEVEKKINESKSIEPQFSIRLKMWFKRFRGIATKYINHYLRWYIDLYSIQNIEGYIGRSIENYIRWREIKNTEIEI